MKDSSYINPKLSNPFLDYATNQRISNLICAEIIYPLINRPSRKIYIDVHDPYNYYNSMDELPSNTLPSNVVIATIPDVKKFSDVKYYDETSALTPWYYSFQESKRRAARWIKTPLDIIKTYCDWIGVNPKPYLRLLSYPLCFVLPLFKKIKTYVHLHYDTLGLAGRYFVDFDTLSGIPPMQLRVQGDDPQKWLTELVDSDYDTKWWFNAFTHSFAECAIYNPPPALTIYEFAVRRWLWVTPGASKFSKLYLDQEYVRTKFGAAVSLTDKEIIQLVEDAMNGKESQNMGVFIKADEVGYKNRLIANVPLGGYIIAAYIRYLIEQWCGEKPIFAKLMPTIDDKIDLINLCRAHYQIYPLDESAYDYHVTRSSWLGFIEFMKYAFPGNQGVLMFESYFDKAYWIFDNQRGKWLKGMPSGLALTSILNSWMNYIKQKTILNGRMNWACGDDVLAVPYQTLTLEEVGDLYKQFGSEAHPAKNWTSYRFGEYLRVLYGEKGTTGYPARIFGTLLYAYDLSFRAPIDKLNENTSLWKQLFDRLGMHMDEDLVAKDLARAISHKVKGFTKKDAKLWLHSPRVHGGFGKLPYSDVAFSWEFANKKIKSYINSRIRLPRVMEDWGECTLHKSKIKFESNVSVYYGRPYSLPPIETEEEWIARLNREDLPDRGPFTSLVLDPIPLPCIDFVSIANMSAFAKTNGFNCYPNLHGTWNTQASRLMKASLNLVTAVLFFMKQQHNLEIFV